MAAKLPEQAIDDLRNAFISMDVNGDGRLQHEEFKKAIKIANIQMTDNEVQHTIGTLDMNGNGYIDYTEFLAASLPNNISLNEDNLR
jgi:calcium-dependent protein kinase